MLGIVLVTLLILTAMGCWAYTAAVLIDWVQLRDYDTRCLVIAMLCGSWALVLGLMAAVM